MVRRHPVHRTVTAKSVLDMSRRVLVFPFLFFKPSGGQTSVLPLSSNSLINITFSTPVLTTSRSSAEFVPIDATVVGAAQVHARSLRRLRRQGWLMRLPSRRELTPLTERPSPPPSTVSTTLVLSDVGNTYHDAAAGEPVFSPQIAEISGDNILSPIITPISPLLSSPVSVLVLAFTMAEDTLGIDQYSVTPFKSPLGPSSLIPASSSGLICSENDIIHEDDVHYIDSENDDSSLCLLDKFPCPPSLVASEMNICNRSASSAKETLRSELESRLENPTEQSRELEPSDQQVVECLQERAFSLDSRFGRHYYESMKTSRSETLSRSPVCNEVHRSFSMSFGMMPTECDARGLGFFSSHLVKA